MYNLYYLRTFSRMKNCNYAATNPQREGARDPTNSLPNVTLTPRTSKRNPRLRSTTKRWRTLSDDIEHSKEWSLIVSCVLIGGAIAHCESLGIWRIRRSVRWSCSCGRRPWCLCSLAWPIILGFLRGYWTGGWRAGWKVCRSLAIWAHCHAYRCYHFCCFSAICWRILRAVQPSSRSPLSQARPACPRWYAYSPTTPASIPRDRSPTPPFASYTFLSS